MIDKMGHKKGWISDVFSSGRPQAGNISNENIAFNLIYRVLVARWHIFQIFIEVAREQHNGSLPDDLKYAWLLFQILPSVRIASDNVFVAFTTQVLQGASTEFLTDLLLNIGPKTVLGSAFDVDRDRFYYVLDEAQVAGERYLSAFADAQGLTRRPVLRPIIRAWNTHTVRWPIQVIVSGTGFSLEGISNVLGSGVAKEPAWQTVHEAGNFIEQATQERYVSRYLPTAFLDSPSGTFFRNRLHDFLRGRSVASFLYHNRN
jgi:hypothetical protein